MLAKDNTAPEPYTITSVGKQIHERVNNIDAMVDRLERIVFFLNGNHTRGPNTENQETSGGLLHGLIYLDGRLDVIQGRLASALEGAEQAIGERDDLRDVPRSSSR